MFTRSNRRAAAFAVAIVACCLALAVAAPAFAYTITGSVVNSATSAPLGGLKVKTWYWHDGDQAWYVGSYAETIGDGSYSFTIYDAGKYLVHVYQNDGWADQWWNLASTESSATTITIPGDTLTGIDFRLVAPKPQPTVTIVAPSTCSYASAKLSGYLTYNSTPLANRPVKILWWSNGGYGTAGTDVTDSDGKWTLSVKPKYATDYQAVFEETAEYAYSTSYIESTLPMVSLTKPAGPSSAKTSTTFTSYSYLKPRHTSGTKPIYIACQRKESGKWITKKSVLATAKNVTLSGVKASKCSAKIRLTKKGSWRLVAVHSKDALNAKATSSKRYITVK